jgi:hypothetical protein
MGAGAIVLMASVLAGAATESLAVGAAALAMLTLSLRQFFFPTTYVIDHQGVSLRCLGRETRRNWNRLRRFRYDARGGFLSTRSRPSLLDAFTGVNLIWAGDAQEAITSIACRLDEGGQTSISRH